VDVAADDVVDIPMEVTAEPDAVQKMKPEMRSRFQLDAVAFTQTGTSARVASRSVALGDVAQRLNVPLRFWPLAGPAELEVAVGHPDMPGYAASRRAALTIGPPRFLYEFQATPRQGGTLSWQAAGTQQKLVAHQHQIANFRVRPSGNGEGKGGLEGTLRLR